MSDESLGQPVFGVCVLHDDLPGPAVCTSDSGGRSVQLALAAPSGPVSQQRVDVDVSYPPSVPVSVVLEENVLPLVRAALQGVSACLLVCGAGSEGCARRWFDRAEGYPGGTLGYVASALFQCLAEAEGAAAAQGGSGAYAAQATLTAVAVADGGPALLDLLAPPLGGGSPSGRLEVAIQEADGPTVRNATVHGPVSSAQAMHALMAAAAQAYDSLCASLRTGSASSASSYEALRPQVSAYLRISLLQLMTPAAAALLAGGAAGSVTGTGALRPDGSVEVRSTLLLVCAPSAPTVLLPLAESAVRIRAGRGSSSAGAQAAGSSLERLFPRTSREESIESLSAMAASQAAAGAAVDSLLAPFAALQAASRGSGAGAGAAAAAALASATASGLSMLHSATEPPSLHPLSCLLHEPCGGGAGGSLPGPSPWLTLVLLSLPSASASTAPSPHLPALRWLTLMRSALTFPLTDSAASRAAAAAHRRTGRCLRALLRAAPAAPLAAQERALLAEAAALDAALEGQGLREENARLALELAARPAPAALQAAGAEAASLRSALAAAHAAGGEHAGRAERLESLLQARPPEVGEVAEGRAARAELALYALGLRRRVGALSPFAAEAGALEALEVAAGVAGQPLGGGRLSQAELLVVEKGLRREAREGLGVSAAAFAGGGEGQAVGQPAGQQGQQEAPSAPQHFTHPVTGTLLSYRELTARARALEGAARDSSASAAGLKGTVEAMKAQLMAARESMLGAREERARHAAREAELSAALEGREAHDGDRGALLKALRILKAHAGGLQERVGVLEGERARLRGALGEALGRVQTVTDVALKHGPMAAAAAAAAAAAVVVEGGGREAGTPTGGGGGGGPFASPGGRRSGTDSRYASVPLPPFEQQQPQQQQQPGHGTVTRHTPKSLSLLKAKVAGGSSSAEDSPDMAAAKDRMAVSAAAASQMLQQLQGSERRCIELLSSNAALAAQVDGLHVQMRGLVRRHEEEMGQLRQQLRAAAAAAAAANATATAAVSGRGSSGRGGAGGAEREENWELYTQDLQQQQQQRFEPAGLPVAGGAVEQLQPAPAPVLSAAPQHPQPQQQPAVAAPEAAAAAATPRSPDSAAQSPESVRLVLEAGGGQRPSQRPPSAFASPEVLPPIVELPVEQPAAAAQPVAALPSPPQAQPAEEAGEAAAAGAAASEAAALVDAPVPHTDAAALAPEPPQVHVAAPSH